MTEKKNTWIEKYATLVSFHFYHLKILSVKAAELKMSEIIVSHGGHFAVAASVPKCNTTTSRGRTVCHIGEPKRLYIFLSKPPYSSPLSPPSVVPLLGHVCEMCKLFQYWPNNNAWMQLNALKVNHSSKLPALQFILWSTPPFWKVANYCVSYGSISQLLRVCRSVTQRLHEAEQYATLVSEYMTNLLWTTISSPLSFPKLGPWHIAVRLYVGYFGYRLIASRTWTEIWVRVLEMLYYGKIWKKI